MLYTSRGGVGNPDLVDNAWMRERYGIDASQYVDFAVMRGDPSDGIPGVPGIGDKTAAVLLNEFGDLDGIIAAADDPSQQHQAPGAAVDARTRRLHRRRAHRGRGQARCVRDLRVELKALTAISRRRSGRSASAGASAERRPDSRLRRSTQLVMLV